MKGLVKAIFDIDTILVRFILRTFGLIVNAEVSTFFFKKKVFLEISQNSQENTCVWVSFLIKKRPWYRCFPVNFAKFLRAPFLQNTSRQLLL